MRQARHQPGSDGAAVGIATVAFADALRGHEGYTRGSTRRYRVATAGWRTLFRSPHNLAVCHAAVTEGSCATIEPARRCRRCSTSATAMEGYTVYRVTPRFRVRYCIPSFVTSDTG